MQMEVKRMTKQSLNAVPRASIICALCAVSILMLHGAPSVKAEGKGNDIIYKKLTKAACLKKPGYIWIEQSKRCVKDTRGSH